MNAIKLSEQIIRTCLEKMPQEKIEAVKKMLENSPMTKELHNAILVSKFRNEIIDIRLSTLQHYRELLEEMPKDLVLERAFDILWDWIQHVDTWKDCYEKDDAMLKNLNNMDDALNTLETIMNVEKAKRFNLL